MRTDPQSVQQRRSLRSVLGTGWGTPKAEGESQIGGQIPLHSGGPVEKTGSYRLLESEFVIPAPQNDDWTAVTIHRIGKRFIAMYDGETPVIINKPKK